jgi:hypothetical protein
VCTGDTYISEKKGKLTLGIPAGICIIEKRYVVAGKLATLFTVKSVVGICYTIHPILVPFANLSGDTILIQQIINKRKKKSTDVVT